MSTPSEPSDAEDPPIIETVIAEVAEAEGVEPLDLTPLYDAVDPDALESLLSSPTTNDNPGVIEVTFRYHGYTVTVTSNGTVEVNPG